MISARQGDVGVSWGRSVPAMNPSRTLGRYWRRLSRLRTSVSRRSRATTARFGEAAFDVCPSPLDRVELWRVGRQQEHRQPLAFGNPLLHRLGDVGVESVPHQHDGRLDQLVDAVQEGDVVALAHAASRALPTGWVSGGTAGCGSPGARRSAQPPTGVPSAVRWRLRPG